MTGALQELYGRLTQSPGRNALVLGGLSLLANYVYVWVAIERAAVQETIWVAFALQMASWLVLFALFLGSELAIIYTLSIANKNIDLSAGGFALKLVVFFSLGVLAYNLAALIWLPLNLLSGYPALIINGLLSLAALLVFPVFNVILLRRTLMLSRPQAISLFVVAVCIAGVLAFILSTLVSAVFYSSLASLGLD